MSLFYSPIFALPSFMFDFPLHIYLSPYMSLSILSFLVLLIMISSLVMTQRGGSGEGESGREGEELGDNRK